jgi:TetR/AcrR family transcriptional regulator, tetracycline repressor protein
MALDRETVVRTALRVLDEVGLDGLTLRRIATELGVQAPALYWHFKNKQELLDEMATTVFADAIGAIELPNEQGTWSEWAIGYGKTLHQLLLRYRDGAKMFSGTYLTDATLYAPMEMALRKFTDAGFSLRDAIVGLSTIYCYTIGFTIEEQAVYPRPGERNQQYDLAKRAKRIDEAQFPLALAAGEESFTRFDERFEQGLQVIIRGLTR